MTLKFRDLGKIIKDSFKSWNEKDPFRLSAVIAYYAVFSLPALLVLIITFAGFFFGTEVVNEKVLGQVKDTMGPETSDQVQEMLLKANEGKTSMWASIIGGVVLIIGATGVFVELQKSLNLIWEVKAAPKKSGILAYLRNRVFSFGLILAIGFLLLVSLVISTALAAFGDWLRVDHSPIVSFLFQVLDIVISLSVISALFALIFKVLPDVKIGWKYAFIGAVFTSLLFTLGKTAIAFYFGKAEPGSGYGAAGSIVLILLWFSYSSMILFFGAEFTKAFSDLYSGKAKPTEFARHETSHRPKAA